MNGLRHNRRLQGLLILAVAIVLAIVASIVGGAASDNHKNKVADTATQSKPAATCWFVKLDPNQGNRVLSNGVTGTPEQVRHKLLAAAQHDPRVLQALWNVTPEGTKNPVTDWHTLVYTSHGAVQGTCYSAQGQDLWHKVAVIYNMAPAAQATAPQTGCNTYVTPGGNAGCKVEVISGNRSGTKFTFPNGTWVIVMHRCGNPVTPHKPTPTPSPKPTPTPTHSPVCKPGEHVSPVDHHTCIVPKNPKQDVLNNPSVPPQVKGPGTSKTQSPGPAQSPVHSPTGCNGSCPGAQPTTSPSNAPTPQPKPSPIATDSPNPTPVCTPAPGGGCQ